MRRRVGKPGNHALREPGGMCLRHRQFGLAEEIANGLGRVVPAGVLKIDEPQAAVIGQDRVVKAEVGWGEAAVPVCYRRVDCQAAGGCLADHALWTRCQAGSSLPWIQASASRPSGDASSSCWSRVIRRWTQARCWERAKHASEPLGNCRAAVSSLCRFSPAKKATA